MTGPGWPFGGSMGSAGATIKADETYIGGKAENRAFGPIPPKQMVMSLVDAKVACGISRWLVSPRRISRRSSPGTFTRTAVL